MFHGRTAMGYPICAWGTASDLAINERRADLDWLRVIAFWLLIYYHTAIAFVPGGIPMIQNAESSVVFPVMAGFLHEFRLALLFLISGVGVSFALRHRNKAQFMRDRAVRLIVPLVYGILVIVPPMIYLEKRFIGAFTGSFADFYPMFFTEGVYPRGNLSWHHYWFIFYLYLYCFLGWPIFEYFKRGTGRQQLAHWSQKLSRGGCLYLAIVPLAVVEILLRAWFPGFPDLIHDWANFSHWFMIFIAGGSNAAIAWSNARVGDDRHGDHVRSVLATREGTFLAAGQRGNRYRNLCLVLCLACIERLVLVACLSGFRGTLPATPQPSSDVSQWRRLPAVLPAPDGYCGAGIPDRSSRLVHIGKVPGHHDGYDRRIAWQL
jgi:cbb3-type cytochrome oxidase subunit 3